MLRWTRQYTTKRINISRWTRYTTRKIYMPRWTRWVYNKKKHVKIGNRINQYNQHVKISNEYNNKACAIRNHRVKILNVSSRLKHTKAQKKSIHLLTNQMTHFPQLDCKLDPYSLFPSGVTIFWICDTCPLKLTMRLTFYLYKKKLIFQNDFGVATYFCFFLKENKIRNKTLKHDSLLGKACF